MKKSVCMASLCLGVFASGAFAADVSIRGSLRETLEGSDNYFLQNTPLGTTFKSLSTLNLDVLARTPGWRYLLSSNVSYYNYFGPGADATNPTSGTPINETFRVDHATDFARYFFAATYNRADVAATQLRESGVATDKAAPSTRSGRWAAGRTTSTGSIPFPGRSRRTGRRSTMTPGQPPFTDAWGNRRLDPSARSKNVVDDLGEFRLA